MTLDTNLENKMVIDSLWHDHPVILLEGEEQEDEQEEDECK